MAPIILDMLGVPDLEAQFHGHIKETGRGSRLIGLLGRAILKHGLLLYGGSEGKMELWLDTETFK